MDIRYIYKCTVIKNDKINKQAWKVKLNSTDLEDLIQINTQSATYFCSWFPNHIYFTPPKRPSPSRGHAERWSLSRGGLCSEGLLYMGKRWISMSHIYQADMTLTLNFLHTHVKLSSIPILPLWLGSHQAINKHGIDSNEYDVICMEKRVILIYV